MRQLAHFNRADVRFFRDQSLFEFARHVSLVYSVHAIDLNLLLQVVLRIGLCLL